jgi:hypothetical protein
MLNTLTERDFQKAFKKWQKRLERCILAEGWWWPSSPKLVLDQSRKLWIDLCTYT